MNLTWKEIVQLADAYEEAAHQTFVAFDVADRPACANPEDRAAAFRMFVESTNLSEEAKSDLQELSHSVEFLCTYWIKRELLRKVGQ